MSATNASSQSRHILITGASSGLGAGLAEHYAASGVHLSLWARNKERLAAVAQKAKDLGATVDIQSIDLSDTEKALSLFCKVDTKQPVDMLINAAGLSDIRSHGAAVEESRTAARMSNVNFTTPVAMSCEAGQRMADRGRGDIILFSSVASFHDLPLATVYAGSKAGIARFATALRAGLAPKKVNVTVIMPGFVDTPMSQKLDGHLPLLVPVAKAIKIMTRAIAKKKAVLVFPKTFQVLRFLEFYAPRWLAHPVLRTLEVMQHPHPEEKKKDEEKVEPKKTVTKKASVKKSPAKKASTKKVATKKTVTKKPVKKTVAKKATTKKKVVKKK